MKYKHPLQTNFLNFNLRNRRREELRKERKKNMDWNGNGNGNGAVPFVSGPAESSFSFLFNYDLHYSVPIPAGTEMMHTMTMQTQEGVETVQIMEMNNCANNSNNNVEEKRKKKKKLTSEQLGSLESSFQEDIKLEPDRKMKLAQELDIDPRQVAVWFQNRRARWKAKQLERSYHSLKHQLHLVSKENQMLQDEVRGLRAVLNEEATKKQVESTYRYWGTASNNQNQGDHHHHHHQRNFVFNNIDDNNQGGMMPYWGVMPSSP